MELWSKSLDPIKITQLLDIGAFVLHRVLCKIPLVFDHKKEEI